jgi:hypothetical protein
VLGPDIFIGSDPWHMTLHDDVDARDSRGVRYYKSLVTEVEMILLPYSVSAKNITFYRSGLLMGSGLRFGRHHARMRCLSLCLTLKVEQQF